VIGTKNNDVIQCTFKLIDYYDEKKSITSMARTTGYTASIIAQLLAKEKIEDKGIIPPEKLGINKILFEEILKELNKRNINITMTIKYTKKIS
jgi:saccharopine dehydrogenase-like NADP-dependent oxidoreductase